MRASKPHVNTQFSDKAIMKALAAHGGLLAGAAKALKTNRPYLSKLLSKRPQLVAFRDELVEETLDLAEGKLISALKKGESWAVIFYLKCKGKGRGYTERNEMTGKDGGPMQVTFKWEGEGADYHAPVSAP